MSECLSFFEAAQFPVTPKVLIRVEKTLSECKRMFPQPTLQKDWDSAAKMLKEVQQIEAKNISLYKKHVLWQQKKHALQLYSWKPKIVAMLSAAFPLTVFNTAGELNKNCALNPSIAYHQYVIHREESNALFDYCNSKNRSGESIKDCFSAMKQFVKPTMDARWAYFDALATKERPARTVTKENFPELPVCAFHFSLTSM
jgi:hypothetical protein